MGSGHEIDVVYALSDQTQDRLNQSLLIDILSDTVTADHLILAKNAVQGTTGEKDRSRAMLTADKRFFKGVGHDPGDPKYTGGRTNAAKPGALRRALRQAMARTVETVTHLTFSKNAL